LKLRYGIENLVCNGSVEADPANPTPTSIIGFTPTGWTVTSATACGSGVRNFTVVSGSLGGSPFGSGSAQSMLWVDTTGTNVGSAISVAQTFTPASAGDGAVFTFDFRLNTSGTQNDFWIRAGTPTAWTSSVHIANSGTTGSLSAIVGGSDQSLCSLKGGTWYRVRVMILAPGCGQSNATLQIAPWTSTGSGTTAAYTVDGVPSTQTSGFSQIYMTSGGIPGQSQSMNLDNIALVCNDPLLNAPEQAWKSQNFSQQGFADPGTSSDLANPSGDGMSNLMKYAMNLNPMLADAAGVTSGSSAIVGGTAYIYLTHRMNLAASDICFGYEQSTDLLHWNPATPEVVSTVQLDQFTDAITVRIPATGGSGNRLFMRLKITKP